MSPPSMCSLLSTTAVWCPKRRQKLLTGSCCAMAGATSNRTDAHSRDVLDRISDTPPSRAVDPSRSGDGPIVNICNYLASSRQFKIRGVSKARQAREESKWRLIGNEQSRRRRFVLRISLLYVSWIAGCFCKSERKDRLVGASNGMLRGDERGPREKCDEEHDQG